MMAERVPGLDDHLDWYDEPEFDDLADQADDYRDAQDYER